MYWSTPAENKGPKADCNIFKSDEEFDHSVSCPTYDISAIDECHTKGKVCHCQYRWSFMR